MPTPKQVQEAERAIAQKLASRPKLKIVKDEREPWVPDCARCNDKVVVRSGPYCDCPAGKESKRLWDAMKASREASRQRRLEKVREKLQRAGGFDMPKRYAEYTPRTLQALIGKQRWDSKRNKSLRAAVEIAISWSDGKLEKPSLLLTGDTGVGKTALMLWACQRRARRTGESKLLIRYAKFINAVQGTYRRDSDLGKEELLLAASTVGILLLDDFGENALATAASNDKQNIVREVLDHRNMHDLLTVIITNLTRGQLQAQFGPDIVGRLREMAILVEISGAEDLRERGAIGWNS